MIFGYMIFNDTSARDIQKVDKQFTRGKGFDTFAPCGPWITTADEIENPQNLKTKKRVLRYSVKSMMIIFQRKDLD